MVPQGFAFLVPAAEPAPRRLRIGYTSSDLKMQHPVAHLVAAMFSQHDLLSVEVYCFALSPSDGSAIRLQVEQAALDAYDGVVTGLAQVRALTQAVRSATTARDAVEAGVEVGTRTSVDLLDAQRELFRARNDLAQARYTYLLNVLQLERSVGDLDREDLARIDKLLVPIPAGAETDIDG